MMVELVIPRSMATTDKVYIMYFFSTIKFYHTPDFLFFALITFNLLGNKIR